MLLCSKTVEVFTLQRTGWRKTLHYSVVASKLTLYLKDVSIGRVCLSSGVSRGGECVCPVTYWVGVKCGLEIGVMGRMVFVR